MIIMVARLFTELHFFLRTKHIAHTFNFASFRKTGGGGEGVPPDYFAMNTHDTRVNTQLDHMHLVLSACSAACP